MDALGLIIDSFAGGGGASTGIELALGRSPDFAINHDPAALAMHEANHPATVHVTENIWRVNPLALTRGKKVFLLHASPDCRHHSKAKGGKPVSRSVRGLADVVLIWAREVQPDIITLENVEEFADWGPLDENDRPCPARKGQEFARWVRALESMGYAVDWRELRACDYGAPTIRKRLFLVARRDGKPILWPAPSHGDPKSEAVKSGALKPWRTAAEIIDWTIACPSIFLTKEGARSAGLRIIRPLAAKTMSRIARGFKRYVLDRPEPFIVSIAHGDSGGRREYPLSEPHRTVTTGANEHAVVTPFIARTDMTSDYQRNGIHPLEDPLNTVTTAGAFAMIAPFLAVNRFGATGKGADEPLPTITANSFIKRPGAGGPLSAVSAFLVPRYGEAPKQEPRSRTLEAPAPTIVPTGNGGDLAAVYLAQHNGNGVIGRDAADPVSTLTTGAAQQQPVMAYLTIQHGQSTGSDAAEPVRAILSQVNHHAVVSLPFMAAYYGTGDGQQCDAPLRTATTKDRFSLADVAAAVPPFDAAKAETAREVAAYLKAQGVWSGNADGTEEFVQVGPYIVYDIGMRMLTPRELAGAQGFPPDYKLDPIFEGKPLTETEQRHKIGNSVSPPPAAALIRANCIDALAMPDVRRKRAVLPVAHLPPVERAGLFAGAAE